MSGFWEKIGSKVEQHESVLVKVGIGGLLGLFSVVAYFFLIDNERNELLFLLAALSILTVFYCSGLGMVKYTFIDQQRGNKKLNVFMYYYASIFMLAWFVILTIMFVVVVSKIVSTLL